LSDTIKTDIDKDILTRIEQIARQEHLEREILLKKWLLEKLDEYEMKKQAELYSKGIVSLAEGSTQAHVSIYKFMDYLQQQKIRSPEQTLDEIQKEFKKAKELINS
jgi:predicted HTH domain antitoxin